jgi:Tfp pilus assembly protein PilX
MRKSIIAAAVLALAGMAGSAQAATLNGTFNVTAVNVKNVNSAQSNATMAAFQAALAMLGAVSDAFTYKGDLNFSTTNNVPQGNSTTTIRQWLDSAGGMVSGLDATFGGLQQSKGNINNGTATTTFYLFERLGRVGEGEFKVTHDDGIEIYDDGTSIGGFFAPTSVKTTTVKGFDGGKFSILYVATNSDPSILNVDANVAPIPLPAALPLLAAGLGGLGLMRLRRKAA